jgi:NAD+ dependent glucose-6-phosphate dehydrogenase
MEKPKLLITGANGLIGKILWKALADDYDLYGVDLKAGGEERIMVADIASFPEIEGIIKSVAPRYVIHLAADPHPDANWESILKNNIVGTRNVYAVARAAGVKRVVFASSNHVVDGYEQDLPESGKVTIQDPPRPLNYYGAGKLFGEGLARMFYDRYQLESICLRIGSVRQSDLPKSEREKKLWLSHRDLVQLFRKSLQAEVGFGVYFGISDNRQAFLDIRNAIEELGYQPQDDSASIHL